MASFIRYAIYFLPPEDGPLARFGASWLGWDVAQGEPVAQPELPGLGTRIAEVTREARKYGLHATLKPPFRLAAGRGLPAVQQSLSALAATQAPVTLDGLELDLMEGGFLALVPRGRTGALNALAARCVTEFDQFRAPAGEAERSQRRAAGLSEREAELLADWGYPYVLDQFRFHVTLTDPLAPEIAETVRPILTEAMPPAPAPFVIDRVAVVGERADGLYERIASYTLSG